MWLQIFNEHIFNRRIHILLLIAHVDQYLVLFARTVWTFLIDRETATLISETRIFGLL